MEISEWKLFKISENAYLSESEKYSSDVGKIT